MVIENNYNIKKGGEIMKIVNKYKFIRATTTVIFLLGMIFNIALAKEDKKYVLEEYTVTAGNTLWQIAEDNKEEGTDTRDFIQELKELNNLQDATIYAGQTIKIKKTI